MRDIGDAANNLMSAGSDGWIARVVAMEGFGGRRSGEALLVRPDGSMVGSILNGSINAEILSALSVVESKFMVGCSVRTPVGDREAVEAGLACGGHAQLLIQRVSSIPVLVWKAIEARRPLLVATLIEGDSAGTTLGVTLDGCSSGSLGDTATDASVVVSAQQALVRKGGTSFVTDADLGPVFVELVSPQPSMMILGDVALSHAIAAQGTLLGWTTHVRDDRSVGELNDAVGLVETMGPVDGVVVLSHDIAASCRVLAAALYGTCGYVGALGSRHTQGLRSQHLSVNLGLSADAISRICGPVGLDLGARTPEETALAIFAEALCVQREKSATSLRSSTGAING